MGGGGWESGGSGSGATLSIAFQSLSVTIQPPSVILQPASRHSDLQIGNDPLGQGFEIYTWSRVNKERSVQM